MHDNTLMELNETPAICYVMDFTTVCTFNTLTQPSTLQKTGQRYGVTRDRMWILETSAHQTQEAEAPTNNSPLIALENLSYLIMLGAEAAWTLIRQRSRRVP